MAFGVHVLRLLTILFTLAVAPALGVTGWYAGLLANVACCLLAVALMTWRGVWRSSGMLTLLPSRLALLALLPLALEALSWTTVPGGARAGPPGWGLWALTLLLVGFNEELTSRGVVLDVLRSAWGARAAVVLTAALFGLQHLSALLTTSRSLGDVAWNVLLSGVYGFALAAFQARYAWLWPLVLVHAVADLTTVTLVQEPSDLRYAAAHVLLLLYGVWLLRHDRRRITG